MSVYVFARYRPGLVGETRRSAHVVTVPTDGSRPESVTALCGQMFPPGVLELLRPWAGMPCFGCCLRIPTGTELSTPEDAGMPVLGGDDRG